MMLEGAPNFEELASFVVQAGQALPDVSVEQIGATMRAGYKAKHRSAEAHGNDTAVINFPFNPAVPTGAPAL
jgi:hypothetical protein